MGGDDRARASGRLALARCLELLANPKRRAVVRYFLDRNAGHAEIDEVVAAIASDKMDRTGATADPDAIAAELFHVHLPQLADAGVLEYDRRHLEIRYHGDPELEAVYNAVRPFE